MHMSLRNLHKLMDLNISPVLLVIHSPTGKAENAVKLAKSTLRKAHHSGQDGYLALLELRNTPSEILNSSPAQRLFARRTRTQVLIARSLLKPSVVQTRPGLQEGKRKQTRYYNRGATELAELKPEQIVRFRPPGSRTWVKAQVDKHADICSYSVRTEDGRKYRRNRRAIRETNENKFYSVTEPSKRSKDVIYKPVLQKSNSFQSKRRSGSDTAPMLENSPADVELPTYSERSLTPDSSVSNSNGQSLTSLTELNKAVQSNEGDTWN